MSNLKALYRNVKKHKIAYAFILPSLIFTALFTFYPIFFGIWMSFHNFYMKPLFEPDFVFLDNYVKLFTDSRFFEVLHNTFFWVATHVITTFLIGFGLALLLNENIGRLTPIFRSLVLSTWAVPFVVSGILWRWLFNTQWGIIPKTLVDLGITGSRVTFLSDPSLVWLALLMYFWWGRFPFVCITMLAALQVVPKSLYESAQIDGANVIQRFRHVTLPCVRSAMVTVLLLTTIMGLNGFAAIWALTKGGPGGHTQVLSTYAYTLSFGAMSGMHLGRSAAISVLLFLLSSIFAILYVKRLVK